MITKESHAIAIKSLRQGQSPRDHGDAIEIGYVLNPKFPDLIPRLLALTRGETRRAGGSRWGTVVFA
jgi:hypothetical protein